jgi:hypothetical protein
MLAPGFKKIKEFFFRPLDSDKKRLKNFLIHSINNPYFLIFISPSCLLALPAASPAALQAKAVKTIFYRPADKFCFSPALKKLKIFFYARATESFKNNFYLFLGEVNVLCIILFNNLKEFSIWNWNWNNVKEITSVNIK